jgi:flagellar protein FliO/FliZ
MMHATYYVIFVVVVLAALGSSTASAADTISDTTAEKSEQSLSENSNTATTMAAQPSHPQPSISQKSTDGKSVVESPQVTSSTRSIKTDNPFAKEFPTVSQPDAGTGIVQVTLGLFVVLLIIAAAAWFTRRFGHFQATAGGTLRIVGGLHLGARERLVVVQVGDQQLLLGVAPGRVSTLHVLGSPLDQGDPNLHQGKSLPGSFREKLNAVLKRESR